jgi:hypothetical protein
VCCNQRRHQCRIQLKVLSGEGRLNPPTLPPVQIAFAGEQSVSQQPASPLHQAALGEVVSPLDQYLADMFRMGEEHCLGAAEVKSGDVTLLLGDSKQEAGCIGLEREAMTE